MAKTRRHSSGRSATLVAVGIFISRLSGLLREQVLAGLLGLGIAADAIRAAIQIPGLLQNMLGEGVLSASFVPVYAELADSDDPEAKKRADALAGTVASLLGLLTALIVFVGIVAARPITRAILPLVSGERLDLTVDLVRIMWAGLGFIVLSAWCVGVLNTHRRFFLSYVAPVVWNAAQVILATIAWAKGWSDADIARAAAWGVAVGGFLQFAIQLPTVLKVAPGIRPALATQMREVRAVGSRFVPAMFGRGVVQLSAFLDLILAGLLAAGAIGGLFLAQVLYLLPIGIFAMSVVAVDLPELAREKRSRVKVAARMRSGHERVAFYVLFSAVAFVTIGKPIVAVLFQRGDFTASDTVFVWLILAAYSLGMVASGASRLFQNACYAQGDVSGPARLAAIRVGIAAVVGALLMVQFDRLGIVGEQVEKLGDLPAFGLLPESVRADESAPQRLGALGLALGSAVASWIEYGLLRRRVRRTLVGTRPYREPAAGLLPAGLLAAALGASLSYVLDDTSPLVSAPVAVGVAGAAYVLAAYWRGSRSAAELLRSAKLVT